jgi:hypothetical protein
MEHIQKNTDKANKKQSKPQEKRMQHLINYFDELPQAHTKDAVDSLTEKIESFSLTEAIVEGFISKKCNLSIKKVTCYLIV